MIAWLLTILARRRQGGGDTLDLRLPVEDVDLISALHATGARIVLVLLSGRPLVLTPSTLDQLSALVAAWLPGTEGDGVADVLFGRRPFSGALSYSWPRSNEQAALAARRPLKAASRSPLSPQREGRTPLFPLGFGLRT